MIGDEVSAKCGNVIRTFRTFPQIAETNMPLNTHKLRPIRPKYDQFASDSIKCDQLRHIMRKDTGR